MSNLKLEEALLVMHNDIPVAAETIQAEIERLTAENERLRAALHRIARMGEFPDEYSVGSVAAEAEYALDQQLTQQKE